MKEMSQQSQRSHHSHVSIAETATVLGSEPQSIPTFSQESEGGVTIHSSSAAALEEEETHDILPLYDRLPEINDVIDGLKTHPRVIGILSTPNILITDELRNWFIDVYFKHEPQNDDDFWYEAWATMHEAIIDNTPTRQGEIKSSKDNYMLDIEYMINHHFSTRQFPSYDGVVPQDFVLKLQCLSQLLGWVYVDYFESLITPPRGKKVIPLEIQLDQCLKELEAKNLNEYFDKGMDRQVYYCAGYLCHAGQTASSKRQTIDGKCIGSITNHFASTQSEIDRLKRDLPSGLADLVDRRSVHGSLSYPNLRFYSLVAKIEYCYSKLATTDNLMIFGGQALGTICNAMTRHETLLDHFTSLYDGTGFAMKTINVAFCFYVKVYSNLRIKDLCRKFNSRLHKTTTVGLRQSLASKRGKGRKAKKRKRNKTPEEPEPTENELHDSLIEIAETGIGSIDDEIEEDVDSNSPN
jgi:hypothetical protein